MYSFTQRILLDIEIQNTRNEDGASQPLLLIEVLFDEKKKQKIGKIAHLYKKCIKKCFKEPNSFALFKLTS